LSASLNWSKLASELKSIDAPEAMPLERHRTFLLITTLLAAVSTTTTSHAAGPPAKPKPNANATLFVPAYFYPAGEGQKEWDRLIAAAEEAPIVAIANPASGPGERVDPNSTKVISQATRAGVKGIGYVSTRYAKQSPAEVKAEIDRWQHFYPAIGGIFVDEQTSDGAHVDYYRKLFDYARSKIKDGFMASNPGVPCDASYFTATRADVICVFEHHAGYDDFALPTSWREAERRHAAFLPYQTADADRMRQRLRRAVELQMGYFYATDDGGADPWDRLPVYWDEEVLAVKELNRMPEK
jgi:hypothetical protein